MATRRRPLEIGGAQLIGRSRGERLLDSYYSKQTQELRKAAQKRRRYVVPKTERPTLKTTSKVNVENLATRTRSPLEALNTMLKHIKNRAKYPKVVKMLLEMLAGNFMNSENLNNFGVAFIELALSDNCTTLAENRKDIMKIYEIYVKPLIEGWENASKEGLCIDEDLYNALRVSLISGLYHNGIHTDDTYQFNTYLTKLSDVFDELSRDYRITYGEHEEKSYDKNVSASVDMQTPKDVISFNCLNEAFDEANEATTDSHLGIDKSVDTPATQNECPRHSISLSSDNTKNEVPIVEWNASNFASDSSVGPDEQGDATFASDDVISFSECPLQLPVSDIQPVATSMSATVICPRKYSQEEIFKMKRVLFHSSLETCFTFRNTPWARHSVESLFQKVYRSRYIFTPPERRQIEVLQASLKTRRQQTTVVAPLMIGESENPVQDGREDRIYTVHGTNVWSAKQTGL